MPRNSRVCGCVGMWVRGYVGAWVCGYVGAWVMMLQNMRLGMITNLAQTIPHTHTFTYMLSTSRV